MIIHRHLFMCPNLFSLLKYQHLYYGTESLYLIYFLQSFHDNNFLYHSLHYHQKLSRYIRAGFFVCFYYLKGQWSPMVKHQHCSTVLTSLKSLFSLCVYFNFYWNVGICPHAFCMYTSDKTLLPKINIAP